MNPHKFFYNIIIGIVVSLFTIPISYHYAISRMHEYDTFVINDIVTSLQDEIIACDPGATEKLDIKLITVLIQGAELKHRRHIDTNPKQLMNIVYHNIYTSPLITRDEKTKYLAIVDRTLDDVIIVDTKKSPQMYSVNHLLFSLVATITSIVALFGSLSMWLSPKFVAYVKKRIQLKNISNKK